MKSKRANLAGFSLPEIMVSIAVVAILTAIGVIAMSNVTEGAQASDARRQVEQLNRALKSFAQSNWDIRTTSGAGSAVDEFKVLRSLQYKAPPRKGRFSLGVPFFPPTWNPTQSSSTEHYRAEWNGVNFRLLLPGQAGTGLKLSFDNSDQSAPYTFPSNYKPEGLVPDPT